MEQDNTTGKALEPDVIDLEDLPDIDIDEELEKIMSDFDFEDLDFFTIPSDITLDIFETVEKMK